MKIIKKISISFLAFIIIISTMGATAPKCGRNGEVSLETRAINAATAIPSFIRILVPNLLPEIMADIDLAASSFREFSLNKTSSNWQKALNIWNTKAKTRLLQIDNKIVKLTVEAADILLSKVSIIEEKEEGLSTRGIERKEQKIEVKFREEDVKRLENLLKGK